jgi:hypothetical protein
MDEITKFSSGMCPESWLIVWEKSNFVVVEVSSFTLAKGLNNLCDSYQLVHGCVFEAHKATLSIMF